MIILLFSILSHAQISIGTTTSFVNSTIAGGIDVRYIGNHDNQQVHYIAAFNHGFTTLGIMGLHGHKFQFGLGASANIFEKVTVMSFDPVIAYNLKRFYIQAGTRLRLQSYGEGKTKGNHFITIGAKLW